MEHSKKALANKHSNSIGDALRNREPATYINFHSPKNKYLKKN